MEQSAGVFICKINAILFRLLYRDNEKNRKGYNMNFFKKLLLFSIATLVIGYLILWSFDAFGPHNPFFAFLLNWLTMSWVAVVGESMPLALPASYYSIKAFERTGRMYEYLGIRLFKKLVRRGPLSVFSPKLRLPKEKTVSALEQLEREMRKAETSHLLLFVVMVLFSVYALLRGWPDAAGWIMVFNILINGYPVMLQRYNRIKLTELIHKQTT
jgi:hypothetical protein